MQQISGLRYGENPHQPAAFYSDLSLAEHGKGGIATALLHHGKEVSSCHFAQLFHWRR
jgi:phosphoribosylaminoimidazolecarboxamide formyltransferase/IMP cyclohydrolase